MRGTSDDAGTSPEEGGHRAERARDAERVAGRLALLQDVTAALSAARDLSEVAGVVADRVRIVLGAVNVTLRQLVDGKGLEIVGAGGLPEAMVSRERWLPLDVEAPACRAALRNEPIWEEAAPEAERAAAGVTRFGRAYAVLPLAPRGQMRGTLTVVFGEPRRIDAEERAFISTVARECGAALERAALYDAEVRDRALLDAVFENAPLGIAFLDRELRFVRVNPTLAEMNGLPPRAHVGRTPRELLPGLPVDELEASWREVIRSGRAVLDREIAGETPAAPGKRRTWLESWYPVVSAGEVLGVGALVREVTEEREAEDFRRNVLGIVGHDLRNPLFALVGAARLLLQSEDLTPERARLAARIFANAERMERIIAVLLDYARVRGGQPLPLRLQPCDLSLIVETIADECEATHPGREVRRKGEGDPNGTWDPDRIAQALVNVVSNALDYSPGRSPVSLSWRGEPDAVIVDVANEGPPIPPDVLPRIFEPFRRGESSGAGKPGKMEGIGLGLFIARTLVVAHGGRIDVRSRPGEPTVFSIRLPRVAPGG